MKTAFTLIELIFTIVIIGVLASVAIPKFSGLSDNAKIAAELSTAASVQSALDSCHGEWIINEGSFICGKSIDSKNDLTSEGYPKNDDLGSNDSSPLDKLLKSSTGGTWTRDDDKYRGPASKDNNVKCKANKPCKDTFWKYDDINGTFTLTDE